MTPVRQSRRGRHVGAACWDGFNCYVDYLLGNTAKLTALPGITRRVPDAELFEQRRRLRALRRLVATAAARRSPRTDPHGKRSQAQKSLECRLKRLTPTATLDGRLERPPGMGHLAGEAAYLVHPAFCHRFRLVKPGDEASGDFIRRQCILRLQPPLSNMEMKVWNTCMAVNGASTRQNGRHVWLRQQRQLPRATDGTLVGTARQLDGGFNIAGIGYVRPTWQKLGPFGTKHQRWRHGGHRPRQPRGLERGGRRRLSVEPIT